MQVKTIVKNLKNSIVFTDISSGSSRGEKTKYEICFKSDEEGIDVLFRDMEKIKGLFDSGIDRVSCDDIPLPPTKQKLKKREPIQNPETVDKFTPELLFDYIDKMFRSRNCPTTGFTLKKYRQKLQEVIDSWDTKEIRTCVAYVVSDEYKVEDGFPRSPSRLIGGSFPITLEAANKWDKEQSKRVATDKRLRDINLKEFDF